ncbi:hypothetical protein ATANTOWER_011498 [Ataeniobius toweri]|uniref:Uncharacterized protein n=1 Tax=Ataeniobius toweri TaxID=208326 RepID=A0ABU7BH30_9TELE|nr:hypothetical protein [Ataeniobius toweri]
MEWEAIEYYQAKGFSLWEYTLLLITNCTGKLETSFLFSGFPKWGSGAPERTARHQVGGRQMIFRIIAM